MKQTNTDMLAQGFFNKEIEAQVSKEIDEKMIPEELETLTVSILGSSVKVNIIKDKTGYTLGHDWGYYNLGIDDQNQIQPFDFGYPKFRYGNPKQAEIPSLEQ